MNLFKNLQIMKKSINFGKNKSTNNTNTYYSFIYNGQKYSFSECFDNYKVVECRNKDYIQGIYSYDNADHPWAVSNHNSDNWKIILNGKVIDTIVSNNFGLILNLLQKYDRHIKQQISHW